MTIYFGLLRKDPDSDFGIDFPDFPGCVTAGSTLQEAREMAAEALQFHIEGMLEEGLPIPPPSAFDAIMADPENAEAIPFPVKVPGRRPRAVRVNVTIPEPDLEAIDKHAQRIGLTRSAFLAWAAKRAMQREREKDHAA
jgi:predicted RNase H-like HicB family nuclease